MLDTEASFSSYHLHLPPHLVTVAMSKLELFTARKGPASLAAFERKMEEPVTRVVTSQFSNVPPTFVTSRLPPCHVNSYEVRHVCYEV